MEITDLEEAYFVEFVPESTFTPEEFSVVKVQRDRAWFAESLPILEAFWDRVVHMRANPEDATGLLEEMESNKKKRKRSPRKEKNIVDIDRGQRCLIVDPGADASE
jgi:hypothetical protein